MSQSFDLICPKTQTRVWIGQGLGSMEAFYSGDAETIDALISFLNFNRGNALFFVDSDAAPEFQDMSPEHKRPPLTWRERLRLIKIALSP